MYMYMYQHPLLDEVVAEFLKTSKIRKSETRNTENLVAEHKLRETTQHSYCRYPSNVCKVVGPSLAAFRSRNLLAT
jgi:hypothetical protein